MINPIYKEERADPLKELLNRLQIAVGELHTASLATVPISRAGMRAGWGTPKLTRLSLPTLLSPSPKRSKRRRDGRRENQSC